MIYVDEQGVTISAVTAKKNVADTDPIRSRFFEESEYYLYFDETSERDVGREFLGHETFLCKTSSVNMDFSFILFCISINSLQRHGKSQTRPSHNRHDLDA